MDFAKLSELLIIRQKNKWYNGNVKRNDLFENQFLFLLMYKFRNIVLLLFNTYFSIFSQSFFPGASIHFYNTRYRQKKKEFNLKQ